MGTSLFGDQTGSAGFEHTLLAACIAVAGVIGLSAWGHGAGDAVAGDGHASSSRRASAPLVTSRQAGALGAVSEAMDLASHMPRTGSAEYAVMRNTVARAFDAERGTGMAALDLRPFIPADFKDYARGFLGSEETAEGLGTLAVPKTERVLGHFPNWLDGLIHDSLGAPDLIAGTFHDRVSWARKSGSLTWHVDGIRAPTGIGAVAAFIGPGTRVMLKAPNLSRFFQQFPVDHIPEETTARLTVGLTREVPKHVGRVLDDAGFGVNVPEGHVVLLTTADLGGAGTFRGLPPTLHARPHLTGDHRLALVRRYGFAPESFATGDVAPSNAEVRAALLQYRSRLTAAIEPENFGPAGEAAFQELFAR